MAGVMSLAMVVGYATPAAAQTTPAGQPNVGNSGFDGAIPNPDPNNPNPIQALQDLGTVKVPGAPPKKGAKPFSFHISSVDNSAQMYLADRTNKGVDIINNEFNNDTFNTTIGGFVGDTGNGDTSGPNGVVTDAQGNVGWAGDGDSTLKVFDINARAVTATISTGGKNRADELALDPADNIIVIANDADDPPFITFVDTTSNKVLSQIKYPDATNGIEQSVYDPADGMFYLAVPQTKTNPGGEIDRIDPRARVITQRFAVQNCIPHGLALNQTNNQLLLGCSGDAMKILKAHAQSQVMDAATGKIVATIDKIGGSDEVWWTPGQNRYYLAASNMTEGGSATGKNTPMLGVIDGATNTWIQNIPTEAGAHSIAASSLDYIVYLPERSAGVEFFTSPPPLNATVYITDQGFSPKIVDVGQGSGALVGIVTFINKGTQTHSITEVQNASPGFKVSAAGGVQVGGQDFNGSNGGNLNFDTGGIGPGQQITVGFQGTDADYVYSSYPDCLNGNTSATFDCKSTYAVHVTDYQGDQSLAKTEAGTFVAPAGTDPHDPSCVEARQQTTVDSMGNPTGTEILCILDHRIRAKTKGNDQKPLTGNIDVSIDDYNGFSPAKMTVAAGTTITWTNKGNLVHSVYYKPAVWADQSSNGHNIADSGALYPGQTYSYTFPIPLTSSASITSAVRTDFINQNMTPNQQGSHSFKDKGKTFTLPPLYQMSVKVDCLPTQFVPFGAAQGVGRGQPCQNILPVLSSPSYLGATKA